MLISEGINQVRAFALSVNAAVVKWHSTHSDKLHQVYVNGRFAGATIELSQRLIAVLVPLSQTAAVKIEIFAVEPQFANTDFSDELDAAQTQAGRVKIEFPRTDNLPAGGIADFYFEDNKLNNKSIKIQPAFADKGGFGLSSFGLSDFGFDGSASIGFGKGRFGQSWFGSDTDMFCWQSSQLQAGNYKFDIGITDNFGNTTDEQVETETITVVPPAKPAETLVVESFDKQSGKLIFQTI
jgi:hypothetical protein